MTDEIFELSREVTVRAMRSLGRLEGCELKVRVSLRGEMDARSGQVFERERLDRILRLAVIEPLDGQLLNELFPHPSDEGLARALYLRLRPLFPDKMLARVSVSSSGEAVYTA